MTEAARVGDAIGHTSALAGLIGGLVAAAIVGAALVLTVASAGAATPVLVGAVMVGAATGAWIGEFLGSLSIFSSITGKLDTGSHNVFINGHPAAVSL